MKHKAGQAPTTQYPVSNLSKKSGTPMASNAKLLSTSAFRPSHKKAPPMNMYLITPSTTIQLFKPDPSNLQSGTN